MTDDIVARLRDETGAAHQRLEARLDVVECVSSAAGRRALVERFYGFHAAAERELAPLLEPIDGLGFDGRRRLRVLREDLLVLGMEEGRALPACPFPAPASAAEGLGCLYVLEGSTLGGKVIRRELEARGQDATGLAFFDPYGSATGERWRSFLAVLRRECPSGEGDLADQTVLGAVSAFRHAEDWLCSARMPT